MQVEKEGKHIQPGAYIPNILGVVGNPLVIKSANLLMKLDSELSRVSCFISTFSQYHAAFSSLQGFVTCPIGFYALFA